MKEILEKIEKEKGIEILYACETGSRAWGFPSPDSDYDVRFIYRHSLDWYLSLADKKDSVEYMEGELDVTGWDLKKSLLLLKKSNAPLIERFQSPIVYAANEKFRNEFSKLAEEYYSPIAVFFHHYSLAGKFMEELKESRQIKLKSYFYLIRSLLSCNWILKSNLLLPMHMEGLVKFISDEKKDFLRELIKLKSGKDENYLHPKDEAMFRLAADLFDFASAEKDRPVAASKNFGSLDTFFKNWVYEEFNNR